MCTRHKLIIEGILGEFERHNIIIIHINATVIDLQDSTMLSIYYYVCVHPYEMILNISQFCSSIQPSKLDYNNNKTSNNYRPYSIIVKWFHF